MKINLNVRLKSLKFWLFLIGFIGTLAAAILPRFGVTADIKGWEGFADDLVTIVFVGLTGLGVAVDPTTPSLSDSDQAMSYQVKSKNQQLQEQVDSLTAQLNDLQNSVSDPAGPDDATTASTTTSTTTAAAEVQDNTQQGAE